MLRKYIFERAEDFQEVNVKYRAAQKLHYSSCMKASFNMFGKFFCKSSLLLHYINNNKFKSNSFTQTKHKHKLDIKKTDPTPPQKQSSRGLF